VSTLLAAPVPEKVSEICPCAKMAIAKAGTKEINLFININFQLVVP
jgi:hypothetical protein